MKKVLIFLLTLLNLVSCMSKQDRTKRNCPPEDFFEGADLKIAQAIYKSNTQEIEKLIKIDHYNINGRGNKIKSKSKTTPARYTYLGYAILVGEVKAAEKLLQLGADVNAVSIQHNTSASSNMELACRNKNNEMIKLLLKYKEDLNPPLCGSPIHELLIENGDKKIIELLIINGADVNHKDYIDGNMIIITALRINRFDYVHYFLDKGANPLMIDYVGNSIAYLVQKEIERGRLSESGLKEYNKIKDRLINEFHVKFPLKNEQRKGMEESIQRYENLSKENKELLGEGEMKRINLFKECLAKGVNVAGKPLD